VAPGQPLARDDGDGDRFYVVLSGMLRGSAGGTGVILRPGDAFGAVAPASPASVRALTPATIVSCDRATFDELLRPHFPA
jgi:CRP-like cAMP-binding protein